MSSPASARTDGVIVNFPRRLPVGVAQRDAEVPGDGLQGVDRDVNQSRDDDKDVDGCPADDEDCHHHQDHAGDPAQIPVLFLLVRGRNK